jgi:hypothetical protein
MPVVPVGSKLGLSINDSHVLTHPNGTVASSAGEMGISIVLPPRAAVPHTGSLAYSESQLHAAVNRWACTRKVNIVRGNHAVVDMKHKKIFVVDAIFEGTSGDFTMVLFYYAEHRGGDIAKSMVSYGNRLLGVVHKQMNFSASIKLVCMTPTPSGRLKTYTYGI